MPIGEPQAKPVLPDESMVQPRPSDASWNQLTTWLRQLGTLCRAE